MAKTIAQLRTEAQTIKNETTIGANTATRVGGFGEDIVDYLEDNPSSGGGTFATGEDVGDVSLFDELSDLEGKTDAQKALMIPNGKAIGEIGAQFEREEAIINVRASVNSNSGYVYPTAIPLEVGKTYKFLVSCDNSGSGNIGVYLYKGTTLASELIVLGKIDSGTDAATLIYKHENMDYKYLGFWNNRSVRVSTDAYVSEFEEIDLDGINSEVYAIYDKVFFEKGALSSGVEVDSNNGMRTTFIPVNENLKMFLILNNTLPAGNLQYLVYYKDNEFVRSENYGLNFEVNVSPSADYNQVRILLYRSANITDEQASTSYAIVNPAPIESNIKKLDKRVKKLEDGGGAPTVEILASDIALDLSTEVLDLSNQATTNQKFTDTTIVSNNSWRLLTTAIPIAAGEYYIVDNSGGMKKFQIAYTNGNGDILKVHGTDSGKIGNYISTHFIDTLNATGMRIAVNATSLSGLHLINGRKFKITNDTKKAAFEALCADGRINVAYMKDTSDVTRIVMALKLAGSYGVVLIPSGRYELSSCIWAGISAQSIEMEPDTILVASSTFSDAYLMDWDYPCVDGSDTDFPTALGESSPLANAHITGGVFNAKGLCGCLHLTNFRGFRINGCQFYNAATSAFKVEKPGYELIMSNCDARNEYAGLTGNVGFDLRCNDCHYHDLVTVNYHVGFKVTDNALIARCHPWIGSTDFATYYPNSIGFDFSGGNFIVASDCYSDTMQTHYKLGQRTKLVGCQTLSYKSDIFPIDVYGDVNLIHNDYTGNVIIGCTFMTTGVTPVHNSGSVAVTEIGCTY